GTVTSNGHNLLGNTTDATGFTGTGDLTGLNPMLAALADNGGPTRTMKLLPGSPAIDAGVAAGATFDQRGKPRYEHPFFILLNVAVGGSFPGNPDQSTTFPQTMLVDYVRVYSDSSATYTPVITNASITGKNLTVNGQYFDSGSV